MNEAIRRSVWWVLAGAVAWQSVVGTTQLLGRIWQSREIGLGQRLAETGDDRLSRELGADFAIVRTLREVARPGEWVLCRVEFTAAALDERAGSIARLTRLRHALFPAPLVTNGGPDPVAAAEAALPAGQSVLVLVLAGEAAPDGRPGWICVQREPGFQAWRLQRG